MLRFAFFVATCGVVLMGMGVVPKTEDIPQFSIPEINLPDQPALLAEIGELALGLPELGERIEARLTRDDQKIDQRPVARAPKLIKVAKADVDDVENLDSVALAPTAFTVNFDLDKATLDIGAEAQLSDFAVQLVSSPAAEVRIFGHTDLTGTKAYNDALGQNRAEQVADYLKENGVKAERITVIMSYGEALPMVLTEEKSRENRRVKVEALGL